MTDIIQTILLAVIIILLIAKNKEGMIIRRLGGKTGVILDSCALIDGRIVDLVRAGFVPSRLIIPRFIMHELQMLADGHDSHKRERARFGLDVAKELQDIKAVKVIIAKSDFKDIKQTDDKLVRLAKKLSADLYTTDFNLNKVANIEGVRVLNINELAGAMRPVALPGEAKTVKIVQKGSGRGQGIGYLEDGTMVVVDEGAKYIGKIANIEISRTHQTVAGKMLFGQVVKNKKQQSRAV